MIRANSTTVSRNKYLFLIISAFHRAWFWLPIWLIFYLRYTDYAGVALIDVVLMLATFCLELPSGMLADKIGKRNTLIIAFLLTALGNIVMGLAPSFAVLLVAVGMMGIAKALTSGADQALLYDSLVEEKRTTEYSKWVARAKTVELISIAVCSVVGGFLYTLSPSLPFLWCAGCSLVTMILYFFTREPHVDSEKYSWRDYLKNFSAGIKNIFDNKKIRSFILTMLAFSSILFFYLEQFDSVMLVQTGWDEKALGMIFAGSSLVVALINFLYTKFYHRIKNFNRFYILVALCFALAVLFSGPIKWWSLLVVVVLNLGFSLIENLNAVFINNHSAPNFRAGTLSVFNALQSLPYILLAVGMGGIIEQNGIWPVNKIMGLIMVGILVAYTLLVRSKMRSTNSR